MATTTATLRRGAYARRRGTWRRWTGIDWAVAAYSAFPDRLKAERDLTTYAELPVVKRERLLEIAVELEVLDGASVVHRSERGVTLARRRKVSHVTHAILTLLTGGLWGIVWIAMCLARKEDRVRYEVDAWGNVWPFSL